MPPITPVTSLALGPEFSIGGLGDAASTATSDSSANPGAFGSMLVDKVSQLNGLQMNAAAQSQALATGEATDASAVVMQVEQAALAMQLAVQLRNKGLETYQTFMQMPV